MDRDAADVLSSPGYPLLLSGPLLALLLLFVGVGVWWLWRKRSLMGPRGVSDLQIHIATTRPLGPRSHLAIVEAAGTRSLIATTPQGVHFLRDLPMSGSDIPGGFDKHLEKAGEVTA